MTRDELVEKLAALSHEQWSGWADSVLKRWGSTHPSGEVYVTRWEQQLNTPYMQLSDAEKESDRVEARKVVTLLENNAEGVLHLILGYLMARDSAAVVNAS